MQSLSGEGGSAQAPSAQGGARGLYQHGKERAGVIGGEERVSATSGGEGGTPTMVEEVVRAAGGTRCLGEGSFDSAVVSIS
jgi:hypothetical protein